MRMQARLLSAEHLEGDNRYHCAYCESKVDALRQIRLHSIPPILCLSLQRFVFDMKVRCRRHCRFTAHPMPCTSLRPGI